jgi:MFS transporter, DHA1 family, multidrug resistance protein
LARIAVVTNVCAVSAPLAGGVLLGAAGWRGLFLVLAGCGVMVALLAALVFRESGAPPPGQPGGLRARDLLVPLRSPSYVRAAAVAVVSFAQVILYVSIAPALLRGHYGLGGVAFGAVFAVTVAALILGTRLAPLLLRRFPARRDPLVATCLAAAAAALLQAGAATADAWPPLAVTVVLFALGNVASGLLISLGATEALTATTAGAGVAAGLLGGLQFGGGAALATLATAAGVSTLKGYGLAGALMCLLSAGLAARARRRPAAAQPAPCPARDVAA